MADVPESLRERIMAAVEGGTAERRNGGTIPEVLRSVGEQLMKETKTAPPTRDTAMTLLAADALITFACEAAGEEESQKLAELR